MVVVVVVGCHNLVPCRGPDRGLADIGEIISGDDFHIWNTAMGDQAGPGVET